MNETIAFYIGGKHGVTIYGAQLDNTDIPIRTLISTAAEKLKLKPEEIGGIDITIEITKKKDSEETK